jgi:hypothetical protein
MELPSSPLGSSDNEELGLLLPRWSTRWAWLHYGVAADRASGVVSPGRMEGLPYLLPKAGAATLIFFPIPAA